MEELRRFRALERLCRKRAAHSPEFKWMWLGQAAKWKIAADLAMSSHFEERSAVDMLRLAKAPMRAREIADPLMANKVPQATRRQL
jgi:hypothetical protein